MPSLYRNKVNKLLYWGFTQQESAEFARQYTMTQFRTLPYLNRMIRSRSLYVGRILSQRSGKVPEVQLMREIKQSIDKLYVNKHWLNKDGHKDPWAMLKEFRADLPPTDADYGFSKSKTSHHTSKEKGSHHPLKGDSDYSTYLSRQHKKRMSLKDRKLIEGGNQTLG